MSLAPSDVSASPADPHLPGLAAGCARMTAAQQPRAAIKAFRHYYQLLCQGASGLIHSRDAQPVARLPDYDELGDCALTGRAHAGQVLILKLNGGLGTTMGLQQSKSLIPLRRDMTFLDFIIRQVTFLRQQLGTPIPLMFMNSFHSRHSTRDALQPYRHLQNEMDLDFQQHKIPKIAADTLLPVHWPADPEKEWCPPGHGDVYTALDTAGLLDTLIAKGYRYVFISNTDNLGASLDIRILGYMVERRIPMLMEVAHRLASDRKGGHLAQDPAGGFLIREFAQCPDAEMAHFQDIDAYAYFNTNNIWIELPRLRQTLRQHGGFLPLPPIFNRKPVDPTQPSSPPVIQMESAMGAAIALLPGAAALRVPRSRFLPVKRCEDLLVIQSDAYQETDSGRLALHAARTDPAAPLMDLDARHYRLYDDMRQRFPYGPPSLIQCQALAIEGDVRFGRDVILKGAVRIVNRSGQPHCIPDNAVIQGEIRV